MNCTSVLNSLRRTISPLLTLPPGVGIQQTRNTFILKRRYKLPILEKGGRIKLWKGRYFIYDMVENTDIRKKENLDVILTSFVEGIGVRGDRLSLHPKIAYNQLLLPGLAVYASPENIKKYEEEVGVPTQTFSSPWVPNTMRVLNKTLLEVFMSADNPWTLTPEHVRSAFREKKIHMGKDCVTLPERPINGPDLEMENKEFYVTVTINQREKVNVRCRIRFRSNNPNKILPDPEAHLKKTEPIYPEFKSILEAMPEPDHTKHPDSITHTIQ